MPSVSLDLLSIKSPALQRPIVEGLNFELSDGASLGIVGQSGAGKSLTALALCGLVPEPLRASGTLGIAGRTIDLGDRKAFRGVRGKGIFLIFQSAALALDPTMRVGSQVAETLRYVGGLSRKAALKRTGELLLTVGLGVEAGDAWPFQLSGGMRQRIQIAIAMGVEPKVLVADEPTSGLDPLVQRQILGLIDHLRTKMKTSLIIISHDLRIIARMAENVCIVKGGRMLEKGPTAKVFTMSCSEYVRGLVEPFLKEGRSR